MENSGRPPTLRIKLEFYSRFTIYERKVHILMIQVPTIKLM